MEFSLSCSFSARWEGFVSPDTTTDSAMFSVLGRGGKLNFSMWLDDEKILNPNRTTSRGIALVRGKKYRIKFEYSQQDMTGLHPAFALQWSLQGSDAIGRATKAVEEADIAIAVVGGGTTVTSGEGIDRSSVGLPGVSQAAASALTSLPNAPRQLCVHPCSPSCSSYKLSARSLSNQRFHLQWSLCKARPLANRG